MLRCPNTFILSILDILIIWGGQALKMLKMLRLSGSWKLEHLGLRQGLEPARKSRPRGLPGASVIMPDRLI